MRKYKIYMMSARNIISYAEKDSDGIYKFNLQARETEKCKVPTASHEQCIVSSNNVSASRR